VTDELADPRPGHPAQVKERDPAVSEVVRREAGYAGCDASPRDCGSEAIAAKALEDRPLRNTILARHEPRDGLEEHAALLLDLQRPSPSRRALRQD